MSPLDPQDVDQALQSGVSYFKLSGILPGTSTVVTITDISKNKKTKFPIAGLDYSYRCTLSNGQVMDVSSKIVAHQLVDLCHKGGGFQQTAVKISRKQSNKIGETPYVVEPA